MSGFVFVRSCVLPLHLYYKVEEHLWLRPEQDGSFTLGFTDVVQTTAGRILTVSFRPVGVAYQRSKTIAVVESAKWLGPLRAPEAGVLLAVNTLLQDDAGLINRSPYHRGWLVRYRPEDAQAMLRQTVTGQEAARHYEMWMARHGVDDCVHCEGYEFLND